MILLRRARHIHSRRRTIQLHRRTHPRRPAIIRVETRPLARAATAVEATQLNRLLMQLQINTQLLTIKHPRHRPTTTVLRQAQIVMVRLLLPAVLLRQLRVQL